jgi:hypothetical protein
MCAILFTFALGIFIAGNRYYRVVPPSGRFIFWDILKAGVYRAVKGREEANAVYGKSIVTEAMDLGYIFIILVPPCLFNVAYEQLGGAWQDTTDRMGKSILVREDIFSNL